MNTHDVKQRFQSGPRRCKQRIKRNNHFYALDASLLRQQKMCLGSTLHSVGQQRQPEWPCQMCGLSPNFLCWFMLVHGFRCFFFVTLCHYTRHMFLNKAPALHSVMQHACPSRTPFKCPLQQARNQNPKKCATIQFDIVRPTGKQGALPACYL